MEPKGPSSPGGSGGMNLIDALRCFLELGWNMLKLVELVELVGLSYKTAFSCSNHFLIWRLGFS